MAVTSGYYPSSTGSAHGTSNGTYRMKFDYELINNNNNQSYKITTRTIGQNKGNYDWYGIVNCYVNGSSVGQKKGGKSSGASSSFFDFADTGTITTTVSRPAIGASALTRSVGCRMRIYTYYSNMSAENGTLKGQTNRSGASGTTAIKTLSIPARAGLGTPAAPLVSGGGNSRIVTVPAVTNGSEYVLFYNTNTGLERYGLVNNSSRVLNLLANRWYTFSYQVLGTGGDTKTSPSTAIHLTTPTAPSNLLAASVAGTTNVNLTWSNNAQFPWRVEIERATNSAFTTGVTLVYDGAAKSSHTDSVAGGPFYYRVRVRTLPDGSAAGGSTIASGGGIITNWSNVSQVTTIIAPTAPSNLKRNTPFDSNTFSLSWNNNATTQAPWSSVQYMVSDDGINWIGDDNGNPLPINTDGPATLVLPDDVPDARIYFRVRSVNPIGTSEWVVSPAMFGITPAPRIDSITNDRFSTDCTFSYDIYYPDDLYEDEYISPDGTGSAVPIGFPQAQVSFSDDDGVTFGNWIPVPSTKLSEETVGDRLTHTYMCSHEVTELTTKRFRFRSIVGIRPDDSGRTSQWTETEPIEVQFEPLAPTATYDKETQTLSMSAPVDNVSDEDRTIRLLIDGIEYDTWITDGGIWELDITPFLPSSRFTIQMESSTYFGFSRSQIQTINFDDVTIGGARGQSFRVALVYEDGTVHQAATTLIT